MCNAIHQSPEVEVIFPQLLLKADRINLTPLTRKTSDAQMVELKLTPVHSGGSCPSFVVRPYVREELNVGTEIIDLQ